MIYWSHTRFNEHYNDANLIVDSRYSPAESRTRLQYAIAELEAGSDGLLKPQSVMQGDGKRNAKQPHERIPNYLQSGTSDSSWPWRVVSLRSLIVLEWHRHNRGRVHELLVRRHEVIVPQLPGATKVPRSLTHLPCRHRL